LRVATSTTELENSLFEGAELKSVKDFSDFRWFDRLTNQVVQVKRKVESADEFVQTSISFDVGDLFAQVRPDHTSDVVAVRENLVE
jgi:hypothetical protein